MKAKDFIIASLIFVIGYIMVFRKQPVNKTVDASVIEKEMNKIQHSHEIKMSEAYRKIDSIILVENVYKTQ